MISPNQRKMEKSKKEDISHLQNGVQEFIEHSKVQTFKIFKLKVHKRHEKNEGQLPLYTRAD